MVNLITSLEDLKLSIFFEKKYVISFNENTKQISASTTDFEKLKLFEDNYDSFKKALSKKRVIKELDFVSFPDSSENDLFMYKEITHIGNIIFLFIPVTSSIKDIVNIKEKIETDEMTGVSNRKYGMDILEQEYLQTIKVGTVCSFLFLDIDRFKETNDSYGHEAGDYVIKNIAKLIKSVTRMSDTVSRIGGDEFLIILPNTGGPGAEIVAMKINNIVRNRACNYREKVEIKNTVSIGLTSIGLGYDGKLEDIMRSADEALYAAKQNGRNRYDVCDYIVR